MRKIKLFGFFLVLIMTLSIFTACDSSPGNSSGGSDTPIFALSDMPEDVRTVMDSATGLAANYALDLDRAFADKYKVLMDSDKGKDHPDYEDLKSTLNQFRAESGASAIYLLTDMDPDDNFFELTIDSSEEDKDWLAQYEREKHFLGALGGVPAAAMSAHEDRNGNLLWSAFAPIHTSDGTVIAILGIDYPASIVSEYPEWNRDSDKWNGAEYQLPVAKDCAD